MNNGQLLLPKGKGLKLSQGWVSRLCRKIIRFYFSVNEEVLNGFTENIEI